MDYAETLNPKRHRDAQMAALQRLATAPDPAARPALRELYAYYAHDGPKRDAGAYMRRKIIDALRPIAVGEDADLLATACETYERLPPAFTEEAGLLRGGALLALAEVDGVLAEFHAARLLTDPHTDRMSGEPAATAARVLANQSAWLPLYLVAGYGDTTEAARPARRSPRTPREAAPEDQPSIAPPEVVAECLRGLVTLPLSLVPGLLRLHGQSRDPVIRIGLFDLLISHRCGPLEMDYLARSLAELEDIDAYRYLVMALAAARHTGLAELLSDAHRLETRRDRLAVLAEAEQVFHFLRAAG